VSRTLPYAVSCSALLLLGTAATWPLLEPAGRQGTLVAAVVALPLQIASFAALDAWWERRDRFLLAWLGGMLLRVAAVVGAAVLVTFSTLPPAPTLLALAGFFLGMLLLEPFFLRRPASTGAEGR